MDVFVTGGSGYIGSRLIKSLLAEGNYNIRALVRKGSELKIPPGCGLVFGDALSSFSYQGKILPGSVFIHLVGVAHPSPSKKDKFTKIDLVSVQEAAKAAVVAKASHFIYISVSQYPSSIMKAYQLVRAEGELILTRTGIRCSFIRPWYVLGPGHWWPIVLIPFYGLFSLFPLTREKVNQQGLVTISQMIRMLVFAIKNPPADKIVVYDVPAIKHFCSKKQVVTEGR